MDNKQQWMNQLMTTYKLYWQRNEEAAFVHLFFSTRSQVIQTTRWLSSTISIKKEEENDKEIKKQTNRKKERKRQKKKRPEKQTNKKKMIEE